MGQFGGVPPMWNNARLMEVRISYMTIPYRKDCYKYGDRISKNDKKVSYLL